MWFALLACQPSGSGTVPDGVTASGDDDDDDDVTTDTGTPVEEVVAPEVTTVTHALHPEFGTVVVVSWRQNTRADVHLEFTVDGAPRRSPARDLPAGDHEELLLGLPYDADTTYRVVAENAEGEATSPTASARTGPYPEGLPVPISVMDTGADPDVPYVLVSMNPDGGNFGSRWWAFVIDRQGRPVWARQAQPRRMTMHPRVTWNVDGLLLDQNSYWPTFDGGAGGTVEELTLDGVVRHTFATPGLHHPHTPMPDGSLAYGEFEAPYVDERLVVVGRDGSRRTLFGCEAWLAAQGEFDEYCGSNTLNYHAPSNTFVFSFYSVDTIVRIDATTGDALQWYGHVAGAWAFDPPDSAFWWQHGGHLRTDGALATSTYDARNPDELVVRVYELDPAAETLHQIEVYGEGEGVYGDEMGEVSELPSGHVLHNYGTLPRLREFTPEGAVVWDVAWANPGHDIGRSTPIADLYPLAGVRP
jgi:hypothetical protein